MSKNQNKADKKSSANNILLTLLSLTLTFIALLVYPNTVDQYSLPKTTLLYLLTIGLLLVFIFLTVKERKLVIYRSVLDLPVTLFVVCAAISLIVSDDPIIGLVGQYGRYEGLPSVICYAVIYFITTQAIRNEKNFEFLIKYMAIGFIPVAVYGVIQTAGLDFLNVSAYGIRVHSTFGNPVIFGAYLVIILPLLAGLARHSEEESWRLLSWFLLILGIVNLIGTESRGAWIGIAISIAAAGFIKTRATREYNKLYTANKRGKAKTPLINKKFAISVLLGCVLAVSVFFIATGNNPAKRITSATSLSSEAVSIRLEAWKTVLLMIKNRPLTGFGFEQMGFWYPQYETEKYAKLVGSGVPDRTHNDLLQVGVDAGMIAVLIYFWIVIIVALKARDSQKKFVYSATLTCAIVGYATQAQTGITSVFIGPMIWCLLGAAASIASPSKPYLVNFEKKANLKPVLYISGLICIALEILAFLPFVADQHIFRGQYKIAEAKEANTLGLVAPEFDSAIDLFPYQNFYNKAAIEYYINYASQIQSEPLTKMAMFVAKNGLSINEHDYELAYDAGEASFTDYKISESDQSLTEAEYYFKKALKLHPFYSDAISRLLSIAMIRDDKAAAIKLANKLVNAGVEDTNAYIVLAEEARTKGDTAKADQYLNRFKALTQNILNSRQ
jgi:O-antigen ligase/ferritin